MNSLHCVHRNYTITANVEEHPGIPTPWAGGCLITSPDGHTTRRLPLPLKVAFLSELENAQRASIAHGKWLVDQQLDRGQALFETHPPTGISAAARSN
ncbi:hypothetical protein [Pseudomonas sp. R5(2019)]|uniref:hypothetical protein n=1 Tax=Pseudomonas sp. R5(2019) TaxID=2697566 RepID=UPI0014132A3A|nr:hypothetical protein [Pseudomonas sp. R5(2019)]NBA96571.1 hypothetical protein [Pseudomonas sp. R5(2019)]